MASAVEGTRGDTTFHRLNCTTSRRLVTITSTCEEVSKVNPSALWCALVMLPAQLTRTFAGARSYVTVLCCQRLHPQVCPGIHLVQELRRTRLHGEWWWGLDIGLLGTMQGRRIDGAVLQRVVWVINRQGPCWAFVQLPQLTCISCTFTPTSGQTPATMGFSDPTLHDAAAGNCYRSVASKSVCAPFQHHQLVG